MIKLSVVIITFNEERNIRRCLESVKTIADEIIVVDSNSTDTTKAICSAYKVRFVEQAFLGYRDQKNLANSLARYDYILSLDADEALSPELLSEVLKVKNSFDFDGYEFNRLTNYNGHWVRYCGWYPDRKIRLFKKEKAYWGGENIHEGLEVNGSVGLLKGDLFHYSYYSISSHVLQANRYSTMEAKASLDAGKQVTITKLVTRPFYQFIKDYIFKRGFLDGRYGFVICFLNSIYVLLKYAKMIDFKYSKTV